MGGSAILIALTEGHEEEGQPVPSTEPDVVVVVRLSGPRSVPCGCSGISARIRVRTDPRHGFVPPIHFLLVPPRYARLRILSHPGICTILDEGKAKPGASTIPSSVCGGEEVGDDESEELEEERSEEVESEDENAADGKVVDDHFSRV